ncbi:hypothetical protein Rumeso_02410 [Rubellimicrobium mesophilum DSM 19309]|uniref:Uncharacterized protein n=1 Tax=Rubellimicrobium mesophilum DSM 19309 TaxID=442562 RepID=A0A017HNN9_9RHOB|nr:hypothetical protein Rumeso_02410 [Rubellimicrobium mesophilum DSM 19309]
MGKEHERGNDSEDAEHPGGPKGVEGTSGHGSPAGSRGR